MKVILNKWLWRLWRKHKRGGRGLGFEWYVTSYPGGLVNLCLSDVSPFTCVDRGPAYRLGGPQQNYEWMSSYSNQQKVIRTEHIFTVVPESVINHGPITLLSVSMYCMYNQMLWMKPLQCLPPVIMELKLHLTVILSVSLERQGKLLQWLQQIQT